MNKYLSIIIPTYNMEKYLPRCLDSVTATVVPDTVEVIVVNDGSKDSSLSIAQSYQAKRPDIVQIIDKENGNYGSCINAALRVVTGKYIKVLDADDWFRTEGLVTYLSLLEKVNADLILTNYTMVYTDGRRKYAYKEWSIYKEYDETLMSDPSFLKMQMHAVTYRTALFCEMEYHQTEGISYTDQEWIFYPMRFVSKIKFFNIDLYQYLLGREGQTMDPNVMRRSFSHHILIVKRMLLEYADWHREEEDSYKNSYFNYRLLSLIRSIYKFELLSIKSSFDYELLKELDDFIKVNLPYLYKSMDNCFIHKFIRYRFIRYYHRCWAKPPRWIRILNAALKKIQVAY
ncbi:glycosyltransferase family 2 protein [Phocaeicola sp.]